MLRGGKTDDYPLRDYTAPRRQPLRDGPSRMRQAARAALLTVRFGRLESFPCPEAAPTMFSLFAKLKQFVQRLRNPTVQDDLQTFQPLLEAIRQAEPRVAALDDHGLQQGSAGIIARARSGAPIEA